MENMSLGVMGEGRIALRVIEDFDLVFLKMPRGKNMEITSVLIS
jgi:hypothetical protein